MKCNKEKTKNHNIKKLWFLFIQPDRSDSHTPEVYDALSFSGLMGDGLYNPLTGLPSNPTVAWTEAPQAERLQIVNIINNFKATNPPCQP
jgi:hypothetical protein